VSEININTTHLIVAFTTGLAIGGLYFGGLWLTVRRLPHSKSPALLMTGSFLARMTLCLTGFYMVMDGQWLPLVVCGAGVLVMRKILVHHLGHKKMYIQTPVKGGAQL
jgi:F1F0 ATPase subunit 2